MAEFEKGQTFFDPKAINIEGEKGKYFIALSNAKYDDDKIVCFVLNTEKRMEKYRVGCNKESQKYILTPKTFSFIIEYTAIMLSQPCWYELNEMYNSKIKLLEKADETLCRQIKNCIDWNYIFPKFAELIKDSFKQPPRIQN